MNDSDRDELLELANGYLEKSLSPEQVTDLESRLERDEEARRIYIDFTHDHAALHWEQIPETGEDVADFSDYRPRRFPSLVQTLFAGAIISLLALVLIRPAAKDATFATMERTEAARWESGDLPTSEGARLGAGSLHLVRGLATITFDSGAEVVLEAPAQFRLVDSMRCELASGTAVAEVGESAQGFVIDTPTAKVIDHGTSFAVNVQRGTGETRTEVFEGLVEVELPESGESVELRTGQRSTVAAGGIGGVAEVSEEGTWAPAAPPRLRGPDWKMLSTSDPGGHDGYVWGGKPNDHVSDELLLLKNSLDLAGPHRKAWIRFALGGIAPGAVREAELTLRFVPTGWGLASHLEDSEFEVWGLTDDALDGWSYPEMTWESAPANVADSGTALDPEKTVLLGTFTVPRGIQAGSFGIRGGKLVEFLNADGNREATLVIVRTTAEKRGGGLVHGIASSRHPTLPAPALAVRVE